LDIDEEVRALHSSAKSDVDLARLERLLNIRSKLEVKEHRPNFRKVIFVPAVIAGLLIVIMSVVRVWNTPFIATIDSQVVNLGVSNAIILPQGEQVKFIHFSLMRTDTGSNIATTAEDQSMEIVRARSAEVDCRMNDKSIRVPAIGIQKSQLKLERSKLDDISKLVIRPSGGASNSLGLSRLTKPTILIPSGCAVFFDRVKRERVLHSISIEPSSLHSMTLGLVESDTNTIVLQGSGFGNLSFGDEFGSPMDVLINRGTIERGSFVLPETAKEHKLVFGEKLTIEANEETVVSLIMSQHSITSHYRGEASSASRGKVNLMPALIEQFSESTRLTIIFTAFLALFGFFRAALRWIPSLS